MFGGKNMIKGEQLSLNLIFNHPTKKPVKRQMTEKLKDMLKRRLGIKCSNPLFFEKTESLIIKFQKTAVYLSKNNIDMEISHASASKVVGSYLEFGQNNLENHEWIKAVKRVKNCNDFSSAVAGKTDQIIQIIPERNDRYKRFIILTDNPSRLKVAGEVRMLNVKGKRNYRIIFESPLTIMGYAKILNDIFYQYTRDQENLMFSFSDLLKLVQQLLINRNSFATNNRLFLIKEEGDWTKEKFYQTYPERDKDVWQNLNKHNQLIRYVENYLHQISSWSLQQVYIMRSDQALLVNESDPNKELVTSGLEAYIASLTSEEDNASLLKLFRDELEHLLPLLPKGRTKPIIKLIRLDNYGIYVPTSNKIALDFRSGHQIAAISHAGIRSFAHQYGHYLDFKYSDHQLSLEPEFLEIVNAYADKVRARSKGKSCLAEITPTEVFAKSFELYLKQIGLNSELICSDSDYRDNELYSIIRQSLMQKISSYYEHQFPELGLIKDKYNNILTGMKV